jgi:hypothetical protein
MCVQNISLHRFLLEDVSLTAYDRIGRGYLSLSLVHGLLSQVEQPRAAGHLYNQHIQGFYSCIIDPGRYPLSFEFSL